MADQPISSIADHKTRHAKARHDPVGPSTGSAPIAYTFYCSRCNDAWNVPICRRFFDTYVHMLCVDWQPLFMTQVYVNTRTSIQ